MSILTLRVECLKAVAPFMGKEETRYYLRGVLFQKGLIVATDGHRLAVPDWKRVIPPDDVYAGVGFAHVNSKYLAAAVEIARACPDVPSGVIPMTLGKLQRLAVSIGKRRAAPYTREGESHVRSVWKKKPTASPKIWDCNTQPT